MKEIGQMTNLRSLRLPASVLRDCHTLAKLPHLERLRLSATRVEISDNIEWAKLKALRVLVVRGDETRINRKALKALLPALTIEEVGAFPYWNRAWWEEPPRRIAGWMHF